jgi:hypothetical protein
MLLPEEKKQLLADYNNVISIGSIYLNILHATSKNITRFELPMGLQVKLIIKLKK